MIRLLYFTDPHIRGTNPRARTDHYPNALKAKLRWLFYFARLERVDAIICGGDLFDRPDTAYAVAGEFAAELTKRWTPLYVVPGNHEIYGYNLDTLPRTILGFLEQIGVIEILNRDPVKLRNGGVNVWLTGQGFYHDIDRNPADYQTGLGKLSGIYKVHTVHGMLVDQPLPHEAPHSLVDDVVTDANVILSGHEHVGYGLKLRPDNVWFCNPGALGRISARAEELYRPVQAAVFTFTMDGIKAELVPLGCAAPGIEVLSRDHLTRLAEREDRMSRFLSLLTAEGESKFLEVRDIVNSIAEKETLPEMVRKNALDRLTAAREALGKTG